MTHDIRWCKYGQTRASRANSAHTAIAAIGHSRPSRMRSFKITPCTTRAVQDSAMCTSHDEPSEAIRDCAFVKLSKRSYSVTISPLSIHVTGFNFGVLTSKFLPIRSLYRQRNHICKTQRFASLFRRIRCGHFVIRGFSAWRAPRSCEPHNGEQGQRRAAKKVGALGVIVKLVTLSEAPLESMISLFSIETQFYFSAFPAPKRCLVEPIAHASTSSAHDPLFTVLPICESK